MGNKIDNSVKIPLINHNTNHAVKHNSIAKVAATAKNNISSQKFNVSIMNFNAGV